MKWFRVATEGATTDGRTISRTWLEQIAKNYDPKRYGARIWMEHFRGIFPDGPFRAYGDVRAVKVQENDEGKLELYAQIDPTPDLVQMTKARQKIYTSIEVDPDFAGTGEANLVGLAVTDSPASLGTEMLQFSAQQGDKSPLAARKQSPHNVFTAAIETALDFSDAEPEQDDKPSLLDSIKQLFSKYRKAGKDELAAFRTDLEATLELFVQEVSTLRTELEQRPAAEQFAALQSAHDQLAQEFTALREQLDNEPDPHTPSRSAATGVSGGVETDC